MIRRALTGAAIGVAVLFVVVGLAYGVVSFFEVVK
jgi:hypothetical protein